MIIFGPDKQPLLDLDKVYEYVVPKSIAAHLKDHDILGAISSTVSKSNNPWNSI
jgi:hypothetical protein